MFVRILPVRKLPNTVNELVMIRFSLSIRELRFITRLVVCSHYAVLAVCIASFMMFERVKCEKLKI